MKKTKVSSVKKAKDSVTTIRKTPMDRELLANLVAKTGLKQADVFRQGLRALAEKEGIK